MRESTSERREAPKISAGASENRREHQSQVRWEHPVYDGVINLRLSAVLVAHLLVDELEQLVLAQAVRVDLELVLERTSDHI